LVGILICLLVVDKILERADKLDILVRKTETMNVIGATMKKQVHNHCIIYVC